MSTCSSIFSLKASYNGVCSRCKRSHVHHSKANYSGIYNDYGVLSGRAEVYNSYCWKVNAFFFAADFLSVYFFLGNYNIRDNNIMHASE